MIDRAVVEIKSGRGGDGALSFLREKNMPKGGPDGGNGGHGGSVIFVARKNINTLSAYRHSKLLAAEDGEKGDKKMRFGRAGADIIVEVPVGTVIFDEEEHRFLADLNEDGKQFLAAKGGRGGRGNAAFKTSRNRVPRIAENGYPGIRKRVILELKILADAGLIGFPSVGKSTFLNIVSKANVPTADYPFTTISPNLGVVTLPDGVSTFVLADLPGLIEGAHEGKGLGITFLRHIERCRVLIHMVSMSGERNPIEDYNIINKELKDYGAHLEDRPQIIVATKMDEEGALERKKAFEKAIKRPVIGISALTDDGVETLIKKAYELISKTEPFPLYIDGEDASMKVYDAHLDQSKILFEISHPSEHLFVISGEEVTKKYQTINLSTDQGIGQLIRYLDTIGVEEELRRKGAKTGDTIRLCDFEFDYLD